jgi:electron-transferring-flavoprotein dehydrogenase
MGAPLDTKAADDNFYFLTEKNSYHLPHFLLPPQLNNDGNYIISLSQFVRWLAQQAEALGVEIYPGFAASEVLYGPDGSVQGVATRDGGIAKDGSHKSTYAPGIELRARQTIFAEGCRGSCSTEVIKKFDLQKGKNVQTYGLGIKEVWKVPAKNFRSGYIQHTIGWPLQHSPNSDVFGGTFLYHMNPDMVVLGMVVGLDYANPYLNPYREFQRWKHHDEVRHMLEGGECISYGARCLNEGGYHSIPKLTFPGGVLVGCSAGFLNSVKIKGTHTAMKSGMLAAEEIYKSLAASPHPPVAEAGEVNSEEAAIEVVNYEKAIYNSWVIDELKVIRNVNGAFHKGMAAGFMHAGLSCFITKGNEPWTFRNTTPDSQRTEPAAQHKEIEYPKNDGVISFDLLSNLARSGTSHEADQPAHLRIKEELKNIPSGEQ